jgi:hypothetical protein
LTIAERHAHFNDTLAELHRNPPCAACSTSAPPTRSPTTGTCPASRDLTAAAPTRRWSGWRRRA